MLSITASVIVIVVAAILGAIIGVAAYVFSARCDKRARAIDDYEDQINRTAIKTGTVEAWAKIKNEIQTPTDTSRYELLEMTLGLDGCFADQKGKYIILPRRLLEIGMTPLWRARFALLIAQAHTSLQIVWPRYYVTSRDPNPPHHFQGTDTLAGD